MIIAARMYVGLVAALAIGRPVVAQQPVKLSAVLTAFLADSGVRIQGLPWTTGAALPVKWQTPKPVPAPDFAKQHGNTLTRVGTVRVAIGTRPPEKLTLTLFGNATGLQQVGIGGPYGEGELPREVLQKALSGEGIALKLIKCDPAKEGESYGNLVFTAKAPGKTMSGLHQNWNCAHDGCGWTLEILYRRNDVAAVECSGG
ncbi:MAG: hypothetical protein ABI647_16085 [Gemmatimonadota bacterium]